VTQPIDLIALDLDGTLLAPDESISAGNRAAISRALKSGIRVVLVTGRGVDTPIRVSRELGLNLPVICCHGALTKDFGANKILEHTPVPLAYAKSMLEFAERNNVAIAVYAEEMFWRPAGSHVYMQDMIGPGWREIPSLLDASWRPARRPSSASWVRRRGRRAAARVRRLAAQLPSTRPGSTSSSASVLSREASKRERADARLCADFQDPERTPCLAVGDSRNDVPMLALGGHRGGDGQRAADEVRQVRALRDRRQRRTTGSRRRSSGFASPTEKKSA
jgi:HAD superfamily hydrolase (TIGR01484 family)